MNYLIGYINDFNVQVIKLSESMLNNNIHKVIAKCSCGNEFETSHYKVKSNHTKSCGCKKYGNNKKHGLAGTPIYKVWDSIRRRCNNPKVDSYRLYGGRGIKICDEWVKSFDSFWNWAKENGYQKGLQIDRIDVNGNYEPDNCRWATPKENSRNRRDNVLVNVNGSIMLLRDALDNNVISSRSNYYQKIKTQVYHSGGRV